MALPSIRSLFARTEIFWLRQDSTEPTVAQIKELTGIWMTMVLEKNGFTELQVIQMAKLFCPVIADYMFPQMMANRGRKQILPIGLIWMLLSLRTDEFGSMASKQRPILQTTVELGLMKEIGIS